MVVWFKEAKMEPNSSQCNQNEQKETGADWNMGNSIYTKDDTGEGRGEKSHFFYSGGGEAVGQVAQRVSLHPLKIFTIQLNTVLGRVL